MMEFEFGFGDENDDEQEKEEELTSSNVTKNDAIVEGHCDCGQQETPARDREKDWNGGHEKSTNCQCAKSAPPASQSDESRERTDKRENFSCTSMSEKAWY